MSTSIPGISCTKEKARNLSNAICREPAKWQKKRCSRAPIPFATPAMRRRERERHPIHDALPPAFLAHPLRGGAAGCRTSGSGAEVFAWPGRGFRGCGFQPRRGEWGATGSRTSQGEKNFPTIGKKVSNHWKNRAVFSSHWKSFFQSLENSGNFFPIVGKPEKVFSNGWKTFRVEGGWHELAGNWG